MSDTTAVTDAAPAMQLTTLDRFVGRQPILDGSEQTFGYELLFRSSAENRYDPSVDGETATARVIDSTLNVVGLRTLTRGKRAFVNMTADCLIRREYEVMPPDLTVIEVLESVQPTQEIIEACRDAKRRGYLLALDDFVNQPGYEPLVKLADIVKIDLSNPPPWNARDLATWCSAHDVCVLAERVETRAQFDACLELGYSYFQGYYFQKPEVIAARDVPSSVQNCLLFIQKVNAPEIDFDELEQLVKRDVAISTRLLRYLGSAFVGLSNVRSIKQGLLMLGEKTLRKWASIMATTTLGEDKPDALVVSSLVRARFCELLAEPAGLAERELDLFLMGLLSLMDALVSRPIDEVLADIHLPHDVRAALLGSNSRMGQIFKLVEACERANAERVCELADSMQLSLDVVVRQYREAIAWGDDVMAA